MNSSALRTCLTAAALAAAALAPAQASVTTIPTSALSPSTQYYTDLIGGGIGAVALGRNDDSYSGPLNLGFSVSFFGQTYNRLWINNNGNVSFNGGLSSYIPSGPTGAAAPLISPWFGDVDTRANNSGVVHVRTDIANEIIVTWDSVGYFSNHDDKLNSFQLVLRGSDYAVPVGEGAIGFFYKGMNWEVTNTSTVAAVGFGDGAGNGEVLAGSIQPGLNTAVANHKLWFDANLAPVNQTPEPASLALLGFALTGLAVFRRQRR